MFKSEKKFCTEKNIFEHNSKFSLNFRVGNPEEKKVIGLLKALKFQV